ncbi:MAG TPA: GGDEF domain-containing protein [Thermomicrobiales bacterium]|nr:GGDEF domain-containing protein [Thermomicrobiales bacterium]
MYITSTHRIRFVLMRQDDDFLRDRLLRFVAPFAPLAMVGAGLLIMLTIAVQWTKHTAEPGLPALLGIAGAVSFGLAPVLRWSALQLRGDLACAIGCVYIAILATVTTVAFSRADADITSSLSFIVILAITPVVFWIKTWHFIVGFASAFAPPVVAMLLLDAPGAHWSLLLMVCTSAAFVGCLGLFVIGSCLYIIHEQNEALCRVSREDDLTGLYRRSHWGDLASALLTRMAVAGQPASLLYLDLDGFKRVNDTHGHGAGDRVLQVTARTLVAALPDDAIVGRPGGDEFVALMPNIGLREAQDLAGRFRERLAEAEPPTNSLDASIGIVEWEPGEMLDEVINRADQQMLRAKGRNRVRYRDLMSVAS